MLTGAAEEEGQTAAPTGRSEVFSDGSGYRLPVSSRATAGAASAPELPLVTLAFHQIMRIGDHDAQVRVI